MFSNHRETILPTPGPWKNLCSTKSVPGTQKVGTTALHNLSLSSSHRSACTSVSIPSIKVFL